MDFDLNEEQLMIKAMARDFAEKEIAPVSKEMNRNKVFSLDLVKRMGELGFLGINIPSQYGGGDGNYMSYAVMLEELARVDLGVAVTASSHLSLGCKTILHWGTEEQKMKYLPKMTSGEMLGALATTEPNVGSDVSSIETTAVQKGDEWIINGNKMWISNGGVCGVVTIVAQTDKSKGHKGLTAFLVERGTPGFSSLEIHNKMGCASSSTAELVLEDCKVPKENILGTVGKGMSVALSAFDSARLGVGARTVGVAQGCIDASIAYAKDRKQFGKPIGSFQLIQELIAEMTVETEAARLMVHRAATKKDKTGEPASLETSMAKYYAAEVAIKAANQAIQIHGSYGYSDEYPVERYFRDVRVSAILEGTSQIQKLIIGRALTGISAF
jgi:butyryl-CoA dehydrogenase